MREVLEKDVPMQQMLLYGPSVIVERVQLGVTTNLLKTLARHNTN